VVSLRRIALAVLAVLIAHPLQAPRNANPIPAAAATRSGSGTRGHFAVTARAASEVEVAARAATHSLWVTTLCVVIWSSM
jgi:hypothetical protein